ncbi:MAG: HNH endonuclease [Candidatus Omnitrophica bacterium]|jgi:putative restriction endonuclease|nr:HNH endonuclease [Candidatus Omnitrophota bacterium]
MENIRIEAFNWLSSQISIHGDVLPRELLAKGFEFEGERVLLVGPQGIFKPRLLELPLSITTIQDGPYADKPDLEGNWLYRYRGKDPAHRDNVGLRELMKRRVPLIYFIGTVPGRYLVVYPVFIMEDYPEQLTFKVMAEDLSFIEKAEKATVISDVDEGRRRYLTASVRVRLHQRGFRELVLDAYRKQCACCKLRHLELLDAAHILPDTSPEGDPIVPNGISLCKLHHAAFDSNFIGIRPDYVIEVKREILEEEDGPLLLHGLQELHQARIILPKTKNLYPDPKRLEKRFMVFRNG